jgi:type I restriction enzyme S subunit
MSELIRDKILGLIPDKWSVRKFNDIIDIIHGYQFRTDDFTKSGVKVFKITQIKGDGFIDISNCDYIAIERLDNFNKNKLKYNDILMALTGATIGKIARFKSDEICLQNYRVGKFISNDKNVLSEDYLYYFLSSNLFFHQLLARQTQSAQQNIGKEDINRMTICFPDLPTQTTIAEILSSLDDKIELNNKINQELENLAQTLFKQWFIDFEFPNENGEPYKSSGGEMVESELGEIPKGWTTEVLSEATKLIRGISYRKPELVLKDEGIAFVNLKCFSINGTFRQDGIKYYNGKYKNEQILCNNDILVAVTDLTQDREIIGMPILWDGSTTALPSLDTCIIRSERLELKNFLYYEFKTKRYKSRIIEHANGSTVLHLSVKGLETYVFPMPNESLLKNWSEIIQPILETINLNINEIIELSKTRDTLLPKLISGGLEINEINN